MSDLTYVIFDSNEVDKIDFNEVMETSLDTLRYSLDQSQTFVKWDTNIVPTCVQNLTTKSPYYTHSEILSILEGPNWYDANLGPH